MSHKFRVAVCGGGISALTLAVTLGRYSQVPIDIYEAASEIGTVGAGLAVWKRTWDIMCRLGLDAEMDKRSLSHPSEGENLALILRRSDQLEEGTVAYQVVSSYSHIPLHRAQLVDMLKSRLPRTCTIHTSKCLESYTRCTDSSYILRFTDGSTATTDVLIGADGVRSAVRKSMFQDLSVQGKLPPDLLSPEAFHKAVEPQWSGITVYRSLIQSQKLREISPDNPLFSAKAPMNFVGKGKHIIAYPISSGTLINFLAFDTDPDGEGKEFQGKWVCDTPKEEVLNLYKGWEPCVQSLLESLDGVVSRWAVHVGGSLPLCVSDSVALIGDAVHAMTTHASAGAGQAMEDAYILGRLLSDELTTESMVPKALKIYQDIRLSVANNVVAISQDLGNMYEFNFGPYDGEDRENKDAIMRWGQAIFSKWRFHWIGIPEDDWKTARRRLTDEENTFCQTEIRYDKISKSLPVA
ncbi:FAD/NAD-P-binding domain-containing protein [Rhodocollybia butyracea]|uniref:FAD/NAD-P-binding domain-containing protein n=1 Tax=Rhodocollybia butyracea TaxID=206335 RepID=A0A9P5U243_9AGAR|nr:FAD/NAD-P-binding domain-containing protein [Rhodocollybia butyracea]